MFYVQTGSQPLLMSQVGDIPPEATELKLFTRRDNGTYLKTYLNEKEIVNGDISAFAGQDNVTLTLEFGRGIVSNFASPNVALDRIEFIPEPSTYGLLLLGAGVFTLFAQARWVSLG